MELTPLKMVGGGSTLVAVAAKFGKVRLIDNRVLGQLPGS
jgi:pantothenate synthetase